MKKTYINPTMCVVKLQTTMMLAASPYDFNEQLNKTGGDGSNALGRDYKFDDEEY